MIKTSWQSILLFGIWIVLVGAAPACAQAEFPTRPIKLVVPFPAGGGIDVTALIAAQALGDVLGQQVLDQVFHTDPDLPSRHVPRDTRQVLVETALFCGGRVIAHPRLPGKAIEE